MNSINILIGIGLLLIFSNPLQSKANVHPPIIDSIGVENSSGKEVVLHRLEARETYYSLSRKYGVTPGEISSFNNNQALKIGAVVKIPTGRSFDQPVTQPSTAPQGSASSSGNSIQYKVGRGETLYTISKRFQVPIALIVKENNLKDEKDIKSGQLLNIPQNRQQAVAPVIEPTIEPEEEETEEAEERRNTLPSNRYGIRQVEEKGVGVWLDGLNADGGNMLALHKTAPVGTVVKITNPMTKKTTFAKIVGRYTDNSNTRDAVIVISKATANLLGILDKRFLINISYGMPVD